jgi:hypothetical protein
MLKRQSERVAQAVEHVTFNHGVVGSSPTALTMLCLQDRDFFDHRPVRNLRWLAILAPWLAISVLAAF